MKNNSPQKGELGRGNPNRRGKCFVKKPACVDVEGHVEQRFKRIQLAALKKFNRGFSPLTYRYIL